MSVTHNMVMPKIEREAMAQNYGLFVISPLESGYGVTVGNALRRVLLSSLEGAAVTSIRVSEVHHEFSDIPGVKEDMTQLLLQVKQLRLKMHEGDMARMRLEVHGEGTVTAADIEAPPEVEIVNPELYLFTVDRPDAQVEVEMTVQRGRGYSPAEERGRLPIGEMPVDAIYSPARRVNYDVGRARVGQMTNFDRLELEIWTDGTLSPETAMSRSAEILIAHLRQIAGVTEESLIGLVEEEVEPAVPSEVYEAPIEQLDLSVRVFNSLKRTGVTSVGEVLDLLEKGPDAMLSIRNFGEKSLDELYGKMRDKGFLQDAETDSEPEAETETETATEAVV